VPQFGDFEQTWELYVVANRPLSIDIRNPLVLKANDLVLLTREDGNFPLDIPGFGLFYRDTCYLGAYALRLHGTDPLLLMASDIEGMAAQIALTNSKLSTINGMSIQDHKLRRQFRSDANAAATAA
jgi:hypothetical protein